MSVNQLHFNRNLWTELQSNVREDESTHPDQPDSRISSELAPVNTHQSFIYSHTVKWSLIPYQGFQRYLRKTQYSHALHFFSKYVYGSVYALNGNHVWGSLLRGNPRGYRGRLAAIHFTEMIHRERKPVKLQAAHSLKGSNSCEYNKEFCLDFYKTIIYLMCT